MLLFRSLLLMLLCSSAQAGELMVSAAASLNQAFSEIASAYQQTHPHTQVLLNFAASGVLLQQVAKGAPVDVLAVADQQTMDSAEQQGLISPGSRVDFAGNALVLIVPQGVTDNPSTLKDLLAGGVKRIAIGNPDAVPAGRYAQTALESAGLWQGIQPLLINTQNVRQALAYAAQGEVDAAFVYSSDVKEAAGKVSVAFAVPLAAPPLYPMATVRSSQQQDEAARFQAFVGSEQGQAILQKHGFIRMAEVR
ncbi:molybdate ABC transporter substrate-binding protein [Ectopseudomonas mendocina]|uniref:Molybdate ABC transporter substrate-binding protein n=1 Tax=Ectopseudomonas mendocina TaxID=300 RepID=A0ABZ2RGC9_ECTME